ncbi:MAG: putative selenium-dependent hydroxylase accessory protein YqeC, partial [Spirochaetales bacterium]|nr:putative selenium-dependent hydroxylase accessory protein YqeC [Spirochaetales bacterium]
ARGKPIKAPAEYEPVIPFDTDIVAGVIGIDCIGTIISDQNVHRPELFTKITGSSIGDILEIHMVNKLLESSEGIFKGTSPKSKKIVIFNKSETLNRMSKAKEIADKISESLNIERILITSMTGNDPVMAVISLVGTSSLLGYATKGANQWNFFRQQQNLEKKTNPLL